MHIQKILNFDSVHNPVKTLNVCCNNKKLTWLLYDIKKFNYWDQLMFKNAVHATLLYSQFSFQQNQNQKKKQKKTYITKFCF